MPGEVLKYDGSFEGLLTCIFDSYEQKLNIVEIIPWGEEQKVFFSETLEIISDASKARRVLTGLKKRISAQVLKKIKFAFLSEIKGIELQIYQMICYIFSGPENAENDFSHPAVLCISNTAKKVSREKHRMEAFVRFRLTRDNIYFSVIEPDFNVLPVIASHFKSRYADQKWLIYDLKRKIGIYFDLEKLQYISINLPDDVGISGANSDYFDESEIYFQKLWKEYFQSTNIKTRLNMRLHIQHVPKRYWKYLSEKSPFA